MLHKGRTKKLRWWCHKHWHWWRGTHKTRDWRRLFRSFYLGPDTPYIVAHTCHFKGIGVEIFWGTTVTKLFPLLQFLQRQLYKYQHNGTSLFAWYTNRGVVASDTAGKDVPYKGSLLAGLPPFEGPQMRQDLWAHTGGRSPILLLLPLYIPKIYYSK